jgi:hypothetical protein
MTYHSEPVRFAQGKLREESAFGCGCAALEVLAMRIHPGIRIDRIPVEGWLGLLWGSVIMVRTLIDVPDARWFFPASLAGGALVAIVLRYWRTGH